MTMTAEAKRKHEQRRREVALLRANGHMDLLEALEKDDAPKAVRRELLASIERDLLRVEGKEPAADDFHRAVVKRGLPAGAMGTRGQAGAGVGVLSGYAAVFNARSVDLGGYVELVKPGTFARSLASGSDVKLLSDHDSGVVLASTGAGTLKVWEDANGLAFEADLGTARQFASDAFETVRRGDMTKMSFGFYIRDDDWREEGTRLVRTLMDVDLFEISAVSFPAYPSTKVHAGQFGLRSQARPRTRRIDGGDWRASAARRRREVELLELTS